MISIELSRRFKKTVREAGREAEVAAALQLVLAGFGNPHAHTGLAIRKLGKNLYECRTALGVFCLLHLFWGGLGMFLLAQGCSFAPLV